MVCKRLTSAINRTWVSCHHFCKKPQKCRHLTQPVVAGVRNAMEAMIFKMISIDVSEVGSEEQLFSLIINLFEFPELYERTWSGMHEHLFYDPMVRVPKKLCVLECVLLKKKLQSLLHDLKNGLNLLREWISNIKSSNQNEPKKS